MIFSNESKSKNARNKSLLTTLATLDNKYKLLSKISEGYSSNVYLGISIEEDEQYIIKVYLQNKRTSDVDFEREVNSLRGISHRNIISLVSYSTLGVLEKSTGEKETDIKYIITKHYIHGDFHNFIQSTGKLSEKTARYYFKKSVDALKHLHSINLAHRDIKPENFFLNERFEIVLGDFGLSSFYSNGDLLDDSFGTSVYKSPEKIEKKKYCPLKNDLFSLGIMLFYFLFGMVPFEKGASTADDFLYCNFTEDIELFFRLIQEKSKTEISFNAKKLITGLLARQDQRFTFQDIEESDWYKEDVYKDEIVYDIMNGRKLKLSKALRV